MRLVGTSGSRDAIGTTLAYRLGQRRVVRQLTAGDGFQASNQRVLLLGLGTSETVPAVEVTWPSGRRQVFEGLPLDGEVVLVEANPERFRELGKFRALGAKTWNHPVLVGNRLLVRNADEMACFELPVE